MCLYTWNITSMLNVAFSISSSCCLLNLTLNSLIALRDFLYLDTLSFYPFQVLFWWSVFDVTSMILGLLFSFNWNYKLPPFFPPICPISFALIFIQVTPFSPVPQWLSLNIAILILPVFSPAGVVYYSWEYSYPLIWNWNSLQ